MIRIVFGVLFLLLAAGCGVISILQFQEKGYLFNNAYIWASKEEREKLDKKPHYRQSAVVFALCAVMLLINALAMLLDQAAYMLLLIPAAIVTLVYAIRSSVKIEQNARR